MDKPAFHYDEPSDTLDITFVPGKGATGVELNENILLRIDKRTRTAASLTVFNYSLVAQRTELGPRSFELTGLDELSDELRELALSLLLARPVSDFLSVSAYSPAGNPGVVVPITSIQSDRITAHAA